MRLVVIGLVATFAFVAPASAAEVEISGAGTWQSGTPITAYSAPGESWQFSFDVPDPIASLVNSQFTNFEYLLNGSPVSGSSPQITFFNTANDGMFDLSFPGVDVSLLGAQVYSGTNPPFSFISGSYTADIFNNISFSPTGSGIVTVGAPTPEPASFILCGIALVGLFVAARRRKA